MVVEGREECVEEKILAVKIFFVFFLEVSHIETDEVQRVVM